MRVKYFTVDGVNPFDGTPGAGLIAVESRIKDRQTIQIPKLGISCADGGIGDIRIFWRFAGTDSQILLAVQTEAEMQDPDGHAWLTICPGAVPINRRFQPDGTAILSAYDLVIENLSSGMAKTTSATVTYEIVVSPEPNEVSR